MLRANGCESLLLALGIYRAENVHVRDTTINSICKQQGPISLHIIQETTRPFMWRSCAEAQIKPPMEAYNSSMELTQSLRQTRRAGQSSNQFELLHLH
jgi:hypothetical protein